MNKLFGWWLTVALLLILFGHLLDYSATEIIIEGVSR